MTEILTSRRKFLLGMTAAVAAVPAARILRIAPALAATPVNERTSYAFVVLPDPYSTVEVHKQLIDIGLERTKGTYFAAVENGKFPTSYIWTGAVPETRAAETCTLNMEYDLLTGTKTWDFESSEVKMERASNAYLVEDGRLKVFGPNQARATPDGVLVEESRTNLLLHSSSDAWMKQIIRLKPGDYVLSWYGPGYIRLTGECVALQRAANIISRKWTKEGG